MGLPFATHSGQGCVVLLSRQGPRLSIALRQADVMTASVGWVGVVSSCCTSPAPTAGPGCVAVVSVFRGVGLGRATLGATALGRGAGLGGATGEESTGAGLGGAGSESAR